MTQVASTGKLQSQMHAIYEVRLEVDRSIASEFTAWLSTHRHEVVHAGSFLKSEVYREETDGETLVLVTWYHAKQVQDIRDYIAHKSAPLREDGVRRFGNKFRAQRRILTFAT